LLTRAPGHAALGLLAGKRVDPDDHASVPWRKPGYPDRGLEAALMKYLHGTGIDGACLRVDRSARVPFDQPGADTRLRQQN